MENVQTLRTLTCKKSQRINIKVTVVKQILRHHLIDKYNNFYYVKFAMNSYITKSFENPIVNTS